MYPNQERPELKSVEVWNKESTTTISQKNNIKEVEPQGRNRHALPPPPPPFILHAALILTYLKF